MIAKLKKKIRCKLGFTAVTFLVMFVVAFPIGMLVPDLSLWGLAWYKAYNISSDTAQLLGEQGGANANTIIYLQDRFNQAGLDPSKWDLMISQYPVSKGDQGVIAFKSSYTLTSLEPFLELTLPIETSSTFTSQVFLR